MKLKLVPHPETPPGSIDAVEVELFMTDGVDMLLCYAVMGSGLLLPEWQSPERADGLWRTTCFELFLRPRDSGAYFEFNFSPSSRWAAYAFDSHREGMRPMTLSVDPDVDREAPPEPGESAAHYRLDAEVDLSDVPVGPLLMGLAAVIEEENGTKSYWALAHPPGRPDFHHPDCFVFELPPPA
ncbi:MAG: hypothetical protein JWO81_1147 [Alphaproteobacteria bacterium]|nr:hypothetical protein [Alphaproteobacteria bacterium]